MSNFIRPFVFQHVPSPNLLVSGSNYVASSDKFVYWAIKQAEQMNDNICYKSISTDKSQADLQNALNDAKEAQISYKDLTLFDISTKIKRVSTLQETNGLVELIKQAKEIESWGKPKINPRYKNIMNINNIY